MKLLNGRVYTKCHKVMLQMRQVLPPPPYPRICRDLCTIRRIADKQTKYVRVIAKKKSQNIKMRFKTGDLVRYNMTVQTYVPAYNYGIGLVMAQRRTDVIVYSITEGKQILVRAGSAQLLSRARE